MNELLDYRGVNPVAEAFFSSLQRELLDQQHCDTRNQLAQAIFEWIETWYNQRRRHSCNGGLRPFDYETANAA
jgi:putative transposase